YVVYANIISLFISSIIKVVLIFNDASVIAFAWTVVLDSFVLSIGLIYFYFKNSKLKIQNLMFHKLTAIELLKDSWPLIFGSLAASIYMQIDQVMIKEMLGNQAVGHYAVAIRLTTLWTFLTVVITNSLAPSIINAKKYN